MSTNIWASTADFAIQAAIFKCQDEPLWDAKHKKVFKWGERYSKYF